MADTRISLHLWMPSVVCLFLKGLRKLLDLFCDEPNISKLTFVAAPCVWWSYSLSFREGVINISKTESILAALTVHLRFEFNMLIDPYVSNESWSRSKRTCYQILGDALEGNWKMCMRDRFRTSVKRKMMLVLGCFSKNTRHLTRGLFLASASIIYNILCNMLM